MLGVRPAIEHCVDAIELVERRVKEHRGAPPGVGLVDARAAVEEELRVVPQAIGDEEREEGEEDRAPRISIGLIRSEKVERDVLISCRAHTEPKLQASSSCRLSNHACRTARACCWHVEACGHMRQREIRSRCIRLPGRTVALVGVWVSRLSRGVCMRGAVETNGRT